MRIVDFDTLHVNQAEDIAMQNYNEECKSVPELPQIEEIPDLTAYAENNLGVAAFKGDEMVGFLCSVSPFENAFGSTGVTGVFSPMGANGAIGNDRAKTYARMYQAAAEKWVKAGASNHAICLYAHDEEANGQFYRYGFGMRCVDAVRDMSKISMLDFDKQHLQDLGYSFAELNSDTLLDAYPLEKRLHRHMLDSPCFMLKPELSEADFLKCLDTGRCFAAQKDGMTIAFLFIDKAGETFICNEPGYIHADGAYCLPEHRGCGILQGLLNLAIKVLKTDGYTHLGVDFESINPAAYGFWLKHFSAYTHSVVRRIDESVQLEVII